jgi:hypothetical protein
MKNTTPTGEKAMGKLQRSIAFFWTESESSKDASELRIFLPKTGRGEKANVYPSDPLESSGRTTLHLSRHLRQQQIS